MKPPVIVARGAHGLPSAHPTFHGIHASIDSGPYVRLEIEGPDEDTLLVLSARGSLARQGMTQFFLEGAEPSFDDLAPKKFLRRFPEGTYEIEGLTRAGEEFEVELSHVLAAPAGDVEVNRLAAAEDCDALLPHVHQPVLIDWDPVTTSHPELGKDGPVVIVRYQLFVEQGGVKLAIDLPPTVTEFEGHAAAPTRLRTPPRTCITTRLTASVTSPRPSVA